MDKFNKLKANEKKYEDLYNQIRNPNEVKEGMKFAMDLEKNKDVRHLMKEAEWFARDNLDDRGWRYRIAEIRERPSEEEERRMSRD